MIEQTVVEGKPATVVYLKRDFTPVEPAEAEMIKVLFEDGGVKIAYKAEDQTK